MKGDDDRHYNFEKLYNFKLDTQNKDIFKNQNVRDDF